MNSHIEEVFGSAYFEFGTSLPVFPELPSWMKEMEKARKIESQRRIVRPITQLRESIEARRATIEEDERKIAKMMKVIRFILL